MPLPPSARSVARSARRAAALGSRLQSVLICNAGELSDVPAAELPPGHRIEEMDMADRGDIARWLALHNEAFGRDWGPDNYRTGLVGHPHYDILRTMFLVDSRGPIGAASLGVFRRNRELGIGHHLAVVPRAQSLGLGKNLARYRYAALAELGIRRVEAETQIVRTASIRMQFGCGLRPKYAFDEWNTPDAASPLLRTITDARLRRLHRQWVAHRRGTTAERPSRSNAPRW